MRRSHADNCAQYLGDDIRWDIAPTNPSLRSVGQSYGRIKVRARDWPERENQRRQRSARGQRIGKQGNGCIAARELFAHDAGANDRSKKERSSQGSGLALGVHPVGASRGPVRSRQVALWPLMG